MPSVPNTTTFTLQDVYNSVHGHASGTAGNLNSCFINAVFGYYDPLYNQDSYAPASSQKRFRNYTPSFGIVPPTVTTTMASSVGFSTVTWGGNVTSDGGASVTEHGIVYIVSTTPVTPTTSDTKVIVGSGGTGSYSTTSSSLADPGPTYYYRAYAINSAGTGYGTVYTFTLAPPTYTATSILRMISGYYPQANYTATTPPTRLDASYGMYLNSVLFTSYAGGKAWWKLTITAFDSNLDGDSYSSQFKLYDGNTIISSFPYVKDVTGYTSSDVTVKPVFFDSGAVTLMNYASPQTCRITYYVTDLNGLVGPTKTKDISYEAGWMHGFIRNIGDTSVTIDASSWTYATVSDRGVCYGLSGVSPVRPGTPGITSISAGGTTGYYSVNITGLTPGTTYVWSPYINANGINYSYSTGSFTTTTPAGINTPSVSSIHDVDYTSSSSTFSCTLSSGANVGDIIFLSVQLNSFTTITTPSGYTEIYKVSGSGTYKSWAIYYKIAVSGDLGASTSVTLGASSTGNISKISLVGKTSAPYFTTVSSSNYYTTYGTSLSAQTSGGLINSLILGYTIIDYPITGTSNTYSGGYTYWSGINIGNSYFLSDSYKTQSANGNMETLGLVTGNAAYIQMFQIQVLPY